VWNGVGDVLLIGSWALVALFLAHYLWFVRWPTARRSLTSWYLLGSNVMWFLLLGLGVVTLWAGATFPARDVIRVGVYALIVGNFATQYVLLVDATRRRQREEGQEDDRNRGTGG
jgi:hypothetical protein